MRAVRFGMVALVVLATSLCLISAASASSWWNDKPLGLNTTATQKTATGTATKPTAAAIAFTTPALEGGDAAWRPPPPLAFRDGTIVAATSSDDKKKNDKNEPASLQGFNWAGFNYIQYGMEFFEGLREGHETSTGDFATVVYRQQLLGFNLVRIPFRFASLFEEEEEEEEGRRVGGEEEGKKDAVADSEEAALRSLAARRLRRPTRTLARRCRLTSRAALKKVLSNPTPPFYSQIDYGSIKLPRPVAPPARPSSYANRNDTTGSHRKKFKNPPSCNWYLPDTSILDRMLWAAQYYVANGFYVILDWHPVDEPEFAAQQDSKLVAHEEKLASDWQALAAAISSLPAWRDGRLRGRIMLEPINEPDRLGMAWNVETKGRLNVTAARLDAEAKRSRGESKRSESKLNKQNRNKNGVAAVATADEQTIAAASAAVGGGGGGGRKMLQEQQQQQQQRQQKQESSTTVDDASASSSSSSSSSSLAVTYFDTRDGSVVSEPPSSSPPPELTLASTEAPLRVAPTKATKQRGDKGLVGVSRADLERGTFNSTQRPLADLLLQTARAIYSVLGDSSLFILEGTNQSYWMPPLSWGGAFITDRETADEHRRQQRKYSDAAPFFDALSSEPSISSRVALGPHVYGPSIGWSAEQTRGAALWKTLSLAFGSRSSFGRAFPVIVTEFGTRLDGADRSKIADDLTWLTDFAKWANAWPETGNAKKIRAWCWWQWSPSAWDTGGLTEDDWLTPRWDKIGNLTTAKQTLAETGGGWGLLPWYLPGGGRARAAVEVVEAAASSSHYAPAPSSTAAGPQPA